MGMKDPLILFAELFHEISVLTRKIQLYDKLSRETPFLTNLSPSGKYQMEDLF